MGSSFDASFKHPFTMTVAGMSGLGKSTFVAELIKNRKDFISNKADPDQVAKGATTPDFDYVFFICSIFHQQKVRLKINLFKLHNLPLCHKRHLR